MARGLTDLAVGKARSRVPAQAWDATVLETPASPTTFLRVELDHQRGVPRDVPWTPRHDLEPKPGDAALVFESNAGALWCAVWWPL